MLSKLSNLGEDCLHFISELYPSFRILQTPIDFSNIKFIAITYNFMHAIIFNKSTDGLFFSFIVLIV